MSKIVFLFSGHDLIMGIKFVKSPGSGSVASTKLPSLCALTFVPVVFVLSKSHAQFHLMHALLVIMTCTLTGLSIHLAGLLDS